MTTIRPITERTRVVDAVAASGAATGAARRRSSSIIGSALVTALALVAGTSAADDTEVYFGQSDPNANNNPNVLFVLDTSGSMGALDGGETTRLERMKVAVKDMLNQAEDLNVGLMQFNSYYGGGPILYPVTNVDEQRCIGDSCGATTISSPVRRDIDDVEEYTGNKGSETVLLDGTHLDLMSNGNVVQSIGLRFDDLGIPRNARITDARLELTARRDDNGKPVTLDIRAESSGDAEPFVSEDGNVSSRDWNDYRSEWRLGNWKTGDTYTSENIAGVIRRVTERSDWCGGNALALMLTESESATGDQGVRAAYTFKSAAQIDGNTQTIRDGETGKEEVVIGGVPTLRVTYETDTLTTGETCMHASTTSTLQASGDDAEENLNNRSVFVNGNVLDMPRAGGTYQNIGLRFPEVDVPRDAVIRRAWMELHVLRERNGRDAADVSVRIRGEKSPYAIPYNGGRRNVSNRAGTTKQVIWDDLPNPAGGVTVKTEDVSELVREIVGQSTWQAGNPMGFMFTHASGTGTRAFTTQDSSAVNAPRLVVEFEDDRGDSVFTGRRVKARDEMISLVDTMVASGGTPIVDALWESSLYFRGEDIRLGKRRGYYDKRYSRISHPDSYTGGRAVYPAGCREDDLNAAECEEQFITGSPVYTSPIESSCQTNHIVFLSDGEANSNWSQSRIRDLTGVDECKDKGGDECGVELVDWLYKNDLSSAVKNRQNVRTHTIAFNLENPTFLRNLANAGGGSLYEAKDSADLLSAFRRIIEGASSIDTSFTAPGATVNQFNRLTHRKDIYFAMFKPGDAPRWSGNLKRFSIESEKKDEDDSSAIATGADEDADADAKTEVKILDRNGNPAVDEETGFFSKDAFSHWKEKDDEGNDVVTPDGHDVRRGGAANQQRLEGIENVGKRRTYTWLGEATAVPAAGVDLTAEAQVLSEANDAITSSILGIGGVSTKEDEVEAYRQELLKWTRGVDVQDEDEDGDRDDTRRHMGDPMHSRPVILNYLEGTTSRSIVFVATNEGYLHAIDTENGQEQFAFMPQELLGNLQEQFDNSAAVDHPYGLDGHLSSWRVDDNGDGQISAGEKAYLFIGLRRGGTEYYALDVSDLDKPRLAWAIRGGEDGTANFEELGDSWSRMTPVRMTINDEVEDVLLFGGGYDEQQDTAQVASDTSPLSGLLGATGQKGRGMFIVRAETGELLWRGLGGPEKRDTSPVFTQQFPEFKYPIPGNLRAIDINRDGLVDQIYAADTGGQLLRFDVKQHHKAGDGDLMVGGVIADFSGPLTTEERRFYSEPDVALIEEAGERFLTVSIGSGWRAHPLDAKVEDRFYVVRQTDVREGPGKGNYGIAIGGGVHRPVTDTDLVSVGTDLDPEIGKYGWYLDLARTGEKILGKSVTFDNSVIFSSYVPKDAVNDCSTGIGSGRAYVLDIVSGAPIKDLDGDGDVDEDDQSIELKHGGLPPEAMILITEDSADEPEVLFGPEQLKTGISNATRRTFWSDVGPIPADEVAEADED